MLKWFKSDSPAGAPTKRATVDDIADLLIQAETARARQDRDTALTLYGTVLSIKPDDLNSLYWLATLRQEVGDFASARQLCERALSIDPDQIGILLRLGSIAAADTDPMLALECYERAARLDRDIADIDALLADQYCFLGRIKEGVSAFDRALARQPDSVVLQSNRLFVLNYANLLRPEELFDEHRRWGEMREAHLRSHWKPHPGPRVPEKRLRIGYVSPDLRQHAVAFFLEPLLRVHDKAAFQIHCFDTSPYPEDPITARLKPFADVWRRVGDLSDDALADAIRASEIDVLVDLSGHTTLHRLLVFARRPAPVQATWLGYLNTTGLTAMDYRITDAHMDPESMTERFHTEKLFRLPNQACFVPARESPSINRLPAALSGAITFGSVNQWSKVTDNVRDVWANILRLVEASRLIVVARGAQNLTFRARIIEDFVSRGAHASQILVEPTQSLGGFLELFHRIDVTLDPFPYSGGTTTMHSLWMGVPVVALSGRSAFSRNSVGPLREVGLGHLVAESTAQYIDIAARLAREIPKLTELRADLRQRMEGSPLVDESGFARNMENGYREMWRKYCTEAGVRP